MPDFVPKWLYVLSLLSIEWLLNHCEAFAPVKVASSSPIRYQAANERFASSSSSVLLHSASESSTTEPDPLDELSEERKANLFQFLLRDLEVEQVPVLGVDAAETHIFQAALWTTMAELSENNVADKVCLVFESIPVDTLKLFVQEFDAIKSDSFLMENVPELKRINTTLVGRGVGPAIVLATSNRTKTDADVYQSIKQSAPTVDGTQWMRAMESFATRTSPGSGTILNRIIGSTDVCDILSGYWTSVCELLTLPEEEKVAIAVSYPPSMEGLDNERHDRYVSVSILMNRMASLFSDISNIYVFPTYDRDAIPRNNKMASLGHLPPSDQGYSGELLDDEKVKLQNYLRRSPLPSVIITREKNAAEVFDKDAVSVLQSNTQEELEEAIKMEAEIISAFE
ncbi:hypothetical protein IV203_035253 [Nitzschia inconspicua]|uniref:Protein BIG1 n=1 Tax=Nitzschia inconspicua TaxID=303405 RepID=A0A9K3LD48_9STRA|nr:hypothetical protein IV203_035253 [Nitzschia inconspicua]